MAFVSGLGDRPDDRRFRNPQSPREESTTFSGLTSPIRSLASQMHAHASPSSDPRGSLSRRFTTNTVPTLPTLSPLSPIGLQRRQAAENVEFTTATYHKVQLLEKKRLEYEFLKEQRRRFEAEMELFDIHCDSAKQDWERLSHETKGAAGHQSEPTTPPEYRENGFPSAFSRPQRYSMQNLTSPQQPGLLNRPGRSGSQITSPPQTQIFNNQSVSHVPSKSMPGSRRGSDEDEDNFEFDISTMNPRTGRTSLNRNSMPITSGRANADLPDLTSVLGHIDTTNFLFGDDDEKPRNKGYNPAASPDVKNYLQMNTTDDKFPILVRRDGDGPMQLSASSAALDLALSQSPGPEAESNGWSSFAPRHRQAQHSLPANNLRKADEFEGAGSNGVETPRRSTVGNRHSMEVRFSPFGDSKRPGLINTPPNGATNGFPKLQSSYSTNDLPTISSVKATNGINGNNAAPTIGVNSHAEQHLHNHNASLGRIPPTAVNRHSRELSGTENRTEESKNTFRSIQSALQASAAPFGPSLPAPNSSAMASSSSSTITASSGTNATAVTSAAMAQYNNNNNNPYYGGYGMQMLNMGMNQLQVNGQPPYNQMPMYGPSYGQFPQQPYQQYAPPPQVQQPPRFPDSQARVIQQRRMQNHEDQVRAQQYDFSSLLPHDIVELCKDQHGCRYLQKQIEGRNQEVMAKIFEAIREHVVELMQDPFANYLCQKLLEFSDDEQRTLLIHNAAPRMVNIALNQHGTRALQKMIEYITTPEQINTIIEALRQNVVLLIQDLNGNHVIQKCLNHLASENAEFIFQAVANSCVAVGTHRHGCCVLQRCIDHATGTQRDELIGAITRSAFALVQDPFGNYVVQYILDLQDEAYSKPLCFSFRGSVPALSKQKFSSNVVEKCIRVSDEETKRMLIEELLQPNEIEKLIRDSYANYVIQTALDYADAPTKIRLVEAIRPMLPSIRQTPYGRRILSKVQEFDNRMSNHSSGQIAPLTGGGQAQLTYPGPMNSQAPAVQSPPPPAYSSMANGYGANLASPQPHRMSNTSLPNHLQSNVQQNFGYRGGQPNGIYY
ncbi:uncharacterized protein K452DRAFT_103838 [Aplosporella prunicola CBS 121167]|uniref:PUM-HD domain-containing protein n=1 Tax=Aplosporella prunicola CBS 121167 TaxID=1176127 RepID=A0A6A6BSY9_9PEZI|nr:uncharacterized protein K452DRAFT_103838 [Aplosporella prunicola CBS 121167]KAF2145947.1 hypothetical protein K452DRAFT_103838 [Aplosporella prunicola CBS 121167]